MSRVNYICRLPHCLKSNVAELRSHKVSWRIQPRNWRQASHRRRQEPPQLIDEPDLGIHLSGLLRLIDTRRGSPKGCYVNQNRTKDPRNGTCEPARGCPGRTIRFSAHHEASASAGPAGHSPLGGGGGAAVNRSILFCFDRALPRYFSAVLVNGIWWNLLVEGQGPPRPPESLEGPAVP